MQKPEIKSVLPTCRCSACSPVVPELELIEKRTSDCTRFEIQRPLSTIGVCTFVHRTGVIQEVIPLIGRTMPTTFFLYTVHSVPFYEIQEQFA